MIGEVVLVFLFAVCIVLTIFGAAERGIFRVWRRIRPKKLTEEGESGYSGNHEA